MKLCLKNAKIGILDKENHWSIIDGNVWVKDGIIEYVGDQMVSGYEEVDCENNLLLPGFVNAHTHSPMTCFRSLADNKPLDKWLNEQIFPREALLTDEDMYWFTKLAILEYLSSGVTSIFDMYFAKEGVAKACEEYGFRLTMCGAVNDFVQSVPEMKELYLKYHNYLDGLIDYKLGFHAQYTTDDALIGEIAALAHELKEPVFTHLSETKKEVADCVTAYQKTPLAYLCDKGIFDYGGGIFHGVYLSDEDISLLKEKHIAVITNPSSNLKLASGIANGDKLLKQEILMAIGTDGAASNNALDMFREMYLTGTLSKVINEDACAVDATDVLKMACINGNLLLGKADVGQIKAGYKADLVLLDLKSPNMQPVNHILENLVYAGAKSNVKFTMVNGKILYRDGSYLLPDSPYTVYNHCNDIVKRKF